MARPKQQTSVPEFNRGFRRAISKISARAEEGARIWTAAEHTQEELRALVPSLNPERYFGMTRQEYQRRWRIVSAPAIVPFSEIL